MIEFDRFVAVFEAPAARRAAWPSSRRSSSWRPTSQSGGSISSHPHFDHIGGIRTYNHIGATIVMHMKNLDVHESRRPHLPGENRSARHPVAMAADRVAEGYNYEASKRTSSSPITRASCACTTSSRCVMSRAC